MRARRNCSGHFFGAAGLHWCSSVSVVRHHRKSRPRVQCGNALFVGRPWGRYGGERSQVECDRLTVGVRETGGALDDLGHRAADLVEIGSVAVGQHTDDVVLAPIADTGLAVGRDVRDLLAVRPVGVPGEKAVRLGRAEPVARCVTFAAVGKRGNEVGAAIVRFGALRRRPEWAWTKEEQLPPVLQETPGEREGHVMRTAGLPYRWLGKEICFDRPRIIVGNFSKARIGKYREIV